VVCGEIDQTGVRPRAIAAVTGAGGIGEFHRE
jgi:hypothetical protein